MSDVNKGGLEDVDLWDMFNDDVKEELKNGITRSITNAPSNSDNNQVGADIVPVDSPVGNVSAGLHVDPVNSDLDSLFVSMDVAPEHEEAIGNDGLPLGVPYVTASGKTVEEREAELSVLRIEAMNKAMTESSAEMQLPENWFSSLPVVETPIKPTGIEEFQAAVNGIDLKYVPAEEEPEVIEGDVVVTGTVLPQVIINKDDLSKLEQALADLKALQELDREADEETTSIRLQLNTTQRLLDKLKSDYAKAMERRQGYKKEVSVAQTIVTEEAHKEAEAQREAELKAKRKDSMLLFHKDMEELNPEWLHYAHGYQKEGAATLALHGSALLADDMGLGKTLSAIMWLDMIKAKRVLIVTPSETNSNFTMEVSMWARHRFTYSLAGADKAGRNIMWDMILKPRVDDGNDLTLTLNFEQLYGDSEYFDKLMEVKWDAIIIDEFHNAKNTKSILFDRLKQLKHSNVDMNPDSETYGKSLVKLLPVTGTFILNKPEDIWTALHLIDEDQFPTIKEFRDFYCAYDYVTQSWGFRPGGEKSLVINLGGRIVKRMLADTGMTLPKQTIINVPIHFDNNYHDQRKIMRQLAGHSQVILDAERKATIIEQIALITRQRQCAVWPAGITLKDPLTGEIMFSVGEEIEESIKMDWTFNHILKKRIPTEEFPNGQRVVVFSQFKTALAELERRLIEHGVRVARYDGDSTREIKMHVKRDFDRKHVERRIEEDGDLGYDFDVVICNFKVGGVGLNFTHATQTIILDKEWNPGKETQAYKRTNRIGQTQETEVWIPCLMGSFDVMMEELNDRKTNMLAGFDMEVDMAQDLSGFLEAVRNI